jgi:hypothetical protein
MMAAAEHYSQAPSEASGLSWCVNPPATREEIAVFTRELYLRRAIKAVTTMYTRERIARHNPDGELPCWCCRNWINAIQHEYRRLTQ